MVHILKRKKKIFDYPESQVVAIFSLSNEDCLLLHFSSCGHGDIRRSHVEVESG